jgi:hypothetical protein
MRSINPILGALALALVGSLSGCVVYEPVAVGPTIQQRFDRSFAAAGSAMTDQGLAITAQDRGAGTIRGAKDGTTIVATLRTLPDGSIQVRFDSSGAGGNDPTLIHRVSEGYDRRMGR